MDDAKEAKEELQAYKNLQDIYQSAKNHGVYHKAESQICRDF